MTVENGEEEDEDNVDIPKSKAIAMYLDDELGNTSTLLDVSELNIVPCEGNVSRKDGNSCGLLKAKLKDKDKNPTGHHRCWASIKQPELRLKIFIFMFDFCILVNNLLGLIQGFV